MSMLEKQITIINKLGLHARASAKFVATAGQFQSRLEVVKQNKRINGKSIMSVMTLDASLGTDITLITDGPDEEQMMDAMINLIQSRFYEKE